MTEHDEAIEALAREVYADLPFDDSTDTKPEWVQRGNSHKQDTARDTARRYAKAFLSTYGDGDELVELLQKRGSNPERWLYEDYYLGILLTDAAQAITTLKAQVAELDAKVDGVLQDAAQWYQEYAEQKTNTETLAAENAKLREALREIEKRTSEYQRINLVGAPERSKKLRTIINCGDIARTALFEHEPPSPKTEA